jgi:DNA mismatch repair protein MutL
VVQSAALARPSVTFTLRRDGRVVREWLRAEDRGERVRQTFKEEGLAPCRGQRGPLVLEAYLSAPEQARAGAAGLSIFVNGRPVRDRGIAVTVAHAYGSVLERGRYPRGVVYLDLPPELVDVNVHPQKAEVRFADARALNDAIYGIVSRELAHAFGVPGIRPDRALPLGRNEVSVDTNRAERGEQKAAIVEPVQTPDVASEGELRAPLPEALEAAPLAVRDAAAAPIRPSPRLNWSSLRFIAQVRATFLICESDEGLYVIDQHAAAERVTFTRLRRDYQSRAVPSQSLLFPVTLQLSPAEVELAERYTKSIAEVGFELRVRGADLLSVHATPRLLQRASPERLVSDLLSELGRAGGRAFSDAVDLALATMACHGSVRAGDTMSPEAASALLEALDGADFAGHCPHGRPIVTFTSWAELERKVGRR